MSQTKKPATRKRVRQPKSSGGSQPHAPSKPAVFSLPRYDERPEAISLLAAIKSALPTLQALLEKSSDHWGYEDLVYRFYHQSFKVYWLQDQTEKIVTGLKALAPTRQLNAWFLQIVAEGTGKRFEMDHNRTWLATTRPMLEAFFHARYFLEMACRYGRELEGPPALLPSGWASVLYLYGLR